MTNKIEMPISPNYVKHWGLWEAIREILQNAFDQGEYNIEYDEQEQRLLISSSGTLEKSTLLLGDSGKGESDRGRFGEGYKLALLVLTRLGHVVKIGTGDEIWTAKIEKSETFQADVLNVYIEESSLEDLDSTCFNIHGITSDQWESISGNYLEDTETEWILDQESERGRIYVGGLFVTKIDKFKQGYAFSHTMVKLDRDRKMIQDFDVSYHASRLWAARNYKTAGNSAHVRALLMARSPDVEYLELHLRQDNTELVEELKIDFERLNGPNALPVATEDEIKDAVAGGRRWVLVPPVVRKLLGRVKDLFVAKRGTPVERLRDVVSKNRYRLDSEIVRELEDIVRILEQK